nr:DUF6629 family protein [uncultured Carboxylicivirga sp.]
MCFSAEVSFGASAVISTVGVVALLKNKQQDKVYFAMIPLMFGIQQFFEGWLWISLENDGYEYVESVATIGFLIFAQLIWPVWVPLSTYKLENNQNRKNWMRIALLVGIILFVILGYRMLMYPVSAQIDGHHVFYQVGHFQSTNWWSGILYLLPAVIPFVISSNHQINYLGVAMLLFFIVAKVFYLKYMISVWCMFAAVLSIYIVFILKKER